ncbi:matrix-remodeling-associated protein 7 [Neocloeon triangulifer]|uniref:matrix-remodeling-associated protein 7 n=1 Tax=Neocloeon triangulifer TaxID=2078957 RepID=UPI00286F95FA|nr:matrix-remodeling-associated protein 7 [Neocloeon triangulifer]
MSWSENFPVYLDNLSTMYTLSVLIAVFALFAAHYYQTHNHLHIDKNKTGSEEEQNIDADEDDPTDSPYVKGEFGGAFGKIKAAKQNVLLKSVKADETEEQRHLEKKTQEEQMAAIWDLLKQQEEKFNVGSKQELEAQLRLYRS